MSVVGDMLLEMEQLREENRRLRKEKDEAICDELMRKLDILIDLVKRNDKHCV